MKSGEVNEKGLRPESRNPFGFYPALFRVRANIVRAVFPFAVLRRWSHSRPGERPTDGRAWDQGASKANSNSLDQCFAQRTWNVYGDICDTLRSLPNSMA